jgi:hypothetical protein
MARENITNLERKLVTSGFKIIDKDSSDHASLFIGTWNILRDDGEYICVIFVNDPETLSAKEVMDYTLRARSAFARHGLSGIWIVSARYTRGAYEVVSDDSMFHLLTEGEFENLLKKPRTSQRRTKSKMTVNAARASIGGSIVANREQIITAVAALLLLFDEKLHALRDERPNSEHARSKQDEIIAEYEQLRGDLQIFQNSVTDLRQSPKKEAEAIKSAGLFAKGISKWWRKSHQRICEKTYDLGLFALAVTICSMAGAGGQMAVAASAALVGGKPVADALKGIAKRFSFPRD